MPTTLYTGKAIALKLGTVEFQEQHTACKMTSEDQAEPVELVTGTTVDIQKGVKQHFRWSPCRLDRRRGGVNLLPRPTSQAPPSISRW